MVLSLILIAFAYLLAGLFARQREEGHRPNCPTGFKAVSTTVLFWPYKIVAVVWRKWRK